MSPAIYDVCFLEALLICSFLKYGDGQKCSLHSTCHSYSRYRVRESFQVPISGIKWPIPFTQSEDSELGMLKSEPDTIYKSYKDISEELQLQQAMGFYHSLDQIPWNLNLPHLNTDCSNMQGEMWLSLSKALHKVFCLCKLS